MSWASFHMVEVMSSPKLLQKRIGYLAATQSFQQDTDVLMLTTNLIKKDLASSTSLEIGIALNGLSQIVTPDLARDLCQDLVAMLNHSRPYIRKKVVLVLYKVFLKYPEALRLSFSRVKEKLDDADPSVVSAVVSVVCELSRKNPKNYLSLAPQLYTLLTTSSNNWMLIKIIKLFASLTPLEPRLIKKLLPPLTSLIQTTPAMSLLYECIYTVITGGFLEAAGEASHSLAAACTNKLRKFLEDPDQNSSHPKLVAEHKDIILECIDDDDLSIRLRALDLVIGMVNRKNIMDIVKRLVSHLTLPSTTTYNANEPPTVVDPAYRNDIVNRILFICSQNQYQNITNFEWYINVLVGITYSSGVNVGEALTSQLMDVSVRVKSVRSFSVKQMYRLLSDKEFLDTAKKRDSNVEVLSAAAWICGEYCSFLDNVLSTLECLLAPSVEKLMPKVQAIYVHSIMKIYAYWITELTHHWDEEVQNEFLKVTQLMRDKMNMFSRSVDLEVQERTLFTLILDNVATSDPVIRVPLILQGLPELFFVYELNPVAPKAQKKVPVPEGLDLEAWIYEPLPDLIADHDSDNASTETLFESMHKPKSKKKSKKNKAHNEEDEEEKIKRRAACMEARRNDPYYISMKNPEQTKSKLVEQEDVDLIPIVELSLEGFDLPVKDKKRRGKKKSSRALTPPPAPVYAEEEMPENAADSGSEEETKNKKSLLYSKKNSQDIFATDDNALNSVDLSTPLGDNEDFPQMKAYSSPEETRRLEEARFIAARREQRAALKDKKKDQVSAKKSSKQSTKKSSKSSDKKKKSKKTDKKDKTDKTPVKEDEGESRTAQPQQLLDTEYVEVVNIEHTSEAEEPKATLKFSIKNKSTELILPRVHMNFIQSFDMKLQQCEHESDMASVSETFELQTSEQVNCMGLFEIQSDARKGLCLRGDLQYDVENVSALHQYPFEIVFPVSLFIKEDDTVDPAQFGNLLAVHGDTFEHHDIIVVEIPRTSDVPTDQSLLHILEAVVSISRLQVVEMVPGAASLYGHTVQNVKVVGLLKCVLSGEEAAHIATFTIELKCTDDAFLQGLVHELSSAELLAALS
ncbi:adaptin N terminal region-domain-containing protein [Spinellus fusiger]|nr:adaptin N terminal region-domain-containing protein [Spinellus fusiger]